MPVRAYIPVEIRFQDRPIEGARLVTLYNPDGDDRNGSMTTTHPLEAGTRGGPLVVIGRREGTEWELTLPEIVVRNKSAVGFEYDILGPIEARVLREGVPDSRSKVEKGLGDYGATF